MGQLLEAEQRARRMDQKDEKIPPRQFENPPKRIDRLIQRKDLALH
jgi:hypothetical protein